MARGGSLLETPWAIAIDPARRDGRIVAESSEEERRARPVALPALARPRPGRGAAAGPGSSASTRTSCAGLRGGRRLQPGDHQRHRLGQEPRLQPAGARRDRRATPKRRALYLYPTKALAQDQARKLAELRPPGLREAIYDGDTPREERPAIRRRSNLVLTNPDMLHVGLLPNHKSWGDFLANLGWVVVDEAHTYRGVFGSHVANVLRRLRRVARAYGSEPRFLLASATIANPVELAERLVGDAVRADRRRRRAAGRARDRDVEPAADRQGDRDAALGALRGGRPARRAGLPGGADDLLPQEPARDRADPALRPREPGARAASRSWRERIAPYRGGYTPQQRREIEARLAAGELLAVVATDALELGIDVGELDAAICVTFPGTVASLRQMWGRAGRRRRGLAVYVAGQDALDQFFCRHPDEFLGRPVEAAILDHDKRADRLPAPDRRRLRAAADRRGRRGLRRRAGASGPSGWSRPGSCAAPAAGCCRGAASSSPRGSRCARPRPTRSR